MKAEEIRNLSVDTNYGRANRYQVLLREIAAQLSTIADALKDLRNVMRYKP